MPNVDVYECALSFDSRIRLKLSEQPLTVCAAVFFLPSSSTLLYSAEWIGVPTYNSFLFYLNLFFCVQGLRMELLNVYLILGSS